MPYLGLGLAIGLVIGGSVDAESMESAITLAEWFKNETLRVYDLLETTDEQREQNKLVKFIQKRGGVVTVRDTMTGCRWIHDSEQAELALNELEYREFGYWRERETTKSGGRPTRDFILFSASASAKPEKPLEKKGFADADSEIEEQIIWTG